eukprot:SAG31_NODE_1109_length_9860_cov_22.119353_7_plen_46_part_00
MDMDLDAPSDDAPMDDDFGGADATEVDTNMDGREMKEDAYLAANK